MEFLNVQENTYMHNIIYVIILYIQSCIMIIMTNLLSFLVASPLAGCSPLCVDRCHGCYNVIMHSHNNDCYIALHNNNYCNLNECGLRL